MKKWLDPLATAWVGVITHKLRSSLTILGIVIGVAAVITLMSIGKGAEAQIISNIESMGSNLVTIQPGARTFGGVRSAAADTLTIEDAEAIAEQVPYISSVAPSYSSNLQLAVGGENMNSQVTGVTPEYMAVNNLEMAEGVFFSANDYQRGSTVVVLGSDVKDTLFGDTNPIGQQMRMGSIIVRVVGILESKGAMWGSPDNAIFIPLTAMQQTVAQPRTAQGERLVSSIALSVSDEEQADYVVAEITSLLRTRHQLSPTDDDDFSIMSMEEIASTLSEAIGTMTLLLGAIAAISLLVGGIGVMNIMLVSVLERTREIGIRKALGARERDIWTQFLIEAAFLTFTGGIIGVLVGGAVSYLISSTGVMTTVVTVDIVVLAVSVSVGIGLFFGFYPAWNASRLNPIEALRSE
ncbi:MAG: ABC transporter permease [Dehalococcoidales bacterium]|nr:ABC transporter permease [Dehalococcoidales bacterium]